MRGKSGDLALMALGLVAAKCRYVGVVVAERIVGADLSEAFELAVSGTVDVATVSVAAAVLLFEAQQQRMAAGMYARRRLDDASFARLLLEWLYPEVADHCRRNALAYPDLDEQGEILDTAGLRLGAKG